MASGMDRTGAYSSGPFTSNAFTSDVLTSDALTFNPAVASLHTYLGGMNPISCAVLF